MERKLIDYLPLFVGEYKEMKAVMDAEQPVFESFSDAVDNARADQFIEDATEEGIARREKNYNIIPKANQTLDERKFAVLAKENESLPYTEESLTKMLETLCGKNGFSLNVFNDAYEVLVKLDLSNESKFDAACKILEEILPANMVRDVRMYNTYALLSTRTHDYLSAYSHDEVRKEVL